MAEFTVESRNRVKRIAELAAYDRETIYQIIDEALVCHVGFVQDRQPFVIPINHARMGDSLVFHGAPASRLVKHIQAGAEVCVAITLLDGLRLARSVVHHSLNYRSAVIFGRGSLVEDEQERLEALKALTEHIVPGRWDDARGPTRQEMQATAVVSLSIESASAKVSSGPPSDEEEDYALPVWAGVLPLRQQALEPEDDPRLSPGIPVPEYIAHYER